MAMLVFAYASVHLLGGREEIKPQRLELAGFPLSLGDWKAKEFSLDKAVEKALELDDYILTDYANAKQDKVNLYVAYYDSQRKGRSPHSPQSSR